MKIIIDLQGAQTESRFLGIGHYTINITKALLKNSDTHDIFIVLNGLLEDTIEPIKKELKGLISPGNIYTWHAPGPINYHEAPPDKRYNAMLIREAFIDSLNPDIVVISSLFEGYYCNAATSIGLLNPSTPVIVINYDLAPLIKPKTNFNNHAYTKFYNEQLTYLNQASMICTTSEYCKQKLTQLNISSSNIVNITGGVLCDPLDSKGKAAKKEQCLINNAFVSNFTISGEQLAEQFSWEISANLLLDALPLIQKKHRAGNNSGVDVNQFISLLNLTNRSNQDIYLTQLAYCLNLNHSAVYGYGKRRLFCDISHLVKFDHKTGIQRVIKEILSRWRSDPSLPVQVIPVYFEFEKSVCICKEAGLSGNLFFPTNNVIQPAKDDIFLGLDFNGQISESIDSGIFLCWRNIGVSIYFVVHDILPILHPEWWECKSAGRKHAMWLHSINKCSNTLIAISKSVKNEVSNWLDSQDQDVTNIEWFHLGADFSTHQDSSSKHLNENLPCEFKNIHFAQAFLMVSTIEPRKGYDQTLCAFEQIWSNNHDYHLVIVGKQGWLTEKLIEKIKTHPELNRKLFWFEGLDDESLNLLYQKCCCLIAASYGEGFGLPLIEAAQKKLPIIARDIPVFREIAQSHAFYFNASEPEELSNAIYNWLKLYKNNQHPKSTDMTFLTWNQSASQLIKIILSISDTSINESRKELELEMI